MWHSGRLDFLTTALDPIHHGAGTAGNTQMLRTQDILQPDGTPARVPFISGNSIKHAIRAAAARYALSALGCTAGSLPKAAVDLLFSGGSLSKAGTTVQFARARELEAALPILGVW